jgi:hypothetical protein
MPVPHEFVQGTNSLFCTRCARIPGQDALPDPGCIQPDSQPESRGGQLKRGKQRVIANSKHARDRTCIVLILNVVVRLCMHVSSRTEEGEARRGMHIFTRMYPPTCPWSKDVRGSLAEELCQVEETTTCSEATEYVIDRADRFISRLIRD